MSGWPKKDFVERAKRDFIDPLLRRRFIRFLLVGGLNTAFSYSVYAILLLLGLGYVVANFLALVSSILFSFKTQGTFVFNNTTRRLIFRFSICWLFIYLCNIAFIGEMLKFGLDAYTAGALAIPPIIVISYLVQKYFVFNKRAAGA
jgi:putative flippase GtrA